MVKEKLGKETIKVLKKMCEYAKVDFNKVDFSKDSWYSKYEWTEKQNDKFKKWLENYLYKNKEARNELMAFPMKNKEAIRRVVNWWMLDYSWKIKDDAITEQLKTIHEIGG